MTHSDTYSDSEAERLLADYDFDLPPAFIAQSAVEPRDSSKLLVVHRRDGALEHRIFREITDYLKPGDALVLNQTRVIPARLQATKTTGGAAEIMLLNRIDDRRWLCMIGAPRIRLGTVLHLIGATALTALVVDLRDDGKRVVEFSEAIEPHLQQIGELPLPPYIHEKLQDPERYQTVYARREGAVAAPTAGLHFTGDLLLKIQAMGVQLIYCTLHVGAGTFLPVRADQIATRTLHEEYAELLPEDAKAINETKLRGGRVVAVGTTSVRTLETAAIKSAGGADADLCPWRPVVAIAEPTSLFIMPGFRYRVVDQMITNFHLPKSTLMMLVSAFAGRELMLRAYEEAKRQQYRFYSLGDATLLTD